MQSSIPASNPNKGKIAHLLFCLLPHAAPVLLFLGILGRGYWLLMPILLLLVVVPLLDTITGWQDTRHFEQEDFSRWHTALFQWNTRLYVLFYMGLVVWVAIHIQSFTGLEIGLLLAASSLMAGIGFAAAHELLHAKGSIDQFLQRIATTFLFYPHYKVIHVRSHHVHTSTEHDENTAWFNESFYAYLVRTIPGSAVRSWQIEARQINQAQREGATGVLRNQMTVYAVGQVALLLILFLISGGWGLLFYAAHIVGAHVVLESVNYIQHYGLLRDQQDGQYEKTGAEHSWDTYHFFSSYVTFRVGHHSYHHIAVKPYYLLATEQEAPKLPTGYFWAIAMVLLPFVWRRVINPRITPPSDGSAPENGLGTQMPAQAGR